MVCRGPRSGSTLERESEESKLSIKKMMRVVAFVGPRLFEKRKKQESRNCVLIAIMEYIFNIGDQL